MDIKHQPIELFTSLSKLALFGLSFVFLASGCSTYQAVLNTSATANNETKQYYSATTPSNNSNSALREKNNQPLPEGISQNWLAEAQKYIRESEYHVKETRRNENRLFQAPNRAHNLRTYFEEDGIRVVPRTGTQDWEWGLKFTGYGSPDDIQPVANATKKISGNRIEYQRNNITEWYINDSKGLEQGFTIYTKPDNDSNEIVIKLAITGNLNARQNNNSIAFHQPKIGHKLNYKKLIAWDANNKILDAKLELSNNSILIAVNTSNATYPVIIDPTTTAVTDTVLTTNQSGVGFGSVSSAGDVNGDGYSDVVVGASTYDSGEIGEGAAFIFHGTATGISSSIPWGGESNINATTILQSNQADARFGFDVSSAGDVNGDGYDDVIIGSSNTFEIGYDDGEIDEGAAFIFHGSTTGISSSLTSDPDGAGQLTGVGADSVLQSNQADSAFGSVVSNAGDVNGDGYDDVLVGASLYDAGEDNEGAAFIFYGSPSGITQSNKNDPDGPGPLSGANEDVRIESNLVNAQLGKIANNAGDVNGDGYADILASGQNITQVHYGSITGISQSPSRTWNIGAASAATAGDVNGDGYDDVIVGDIGYSGPEILEGAAFIYHGNSSGLPSTPNTVLQSNQQEQNTFGGYIVRDFGYRVASAGDINADGFSDVLVGAGDDPEGPPDGYHIFLGSSSGLTASETSDPDGSGPLTGINADLFIPIITTSGGSIRSSQIASVGDINGDSFSDIAITTGSARIYHGSATGIISSDSSNPSITDGIKADTALQSNQTEDGNSFLDAQFGISVAVAGDVNGDGFSDVIIGAENYDAGSSNEGAAFVFHGSSNGIASSDPSNANPFTGIMAATMLQSNQPDSDFGRSVSGAGDVDADGFSDVIVGAPLYDDGEIDEGATFIFLGSPSGIISSDSADPNPITGIKADATLQPNQADASFGASVAGAGDINGDGYADIIIGASQEFFGDYADGESGEGAAFVFHGSPSGIESSDSTDPNPITGIKADATLQPNQAGASFGVSVAGAGDINGDGYCDIVVGAETYADGENSEGAAFLFLGSETGIASSDSSNPDPTTGVKASSVLQSNQESALFGSSVSSAGDTNGDGFDDIIIGSRRYGPFGDPQSSEGAAFIFTGSGSGIASSSNANPDPASGIGSASTLQSNQANAAFGTSVSNAGDVNGDGYADVIVGAIDYDQNLQSEGAAFVFNGGPNGIISSDPVLADPFTGVLSSAMLQSNQGGAFIGAELGSSVSSAGDVNGDGYSDVIVGAPFYDDGQTDEGAAFLFLGNNGQGRQYLPVLLQQSSSDIALNRILNTIRVQMTAYHPRGNGKVKLEIEICPTGQSFGSNACEITIPLFWTDVTSTGMELITENDSLAEGFYRIRARLNFDPTTLNILDSAFSPWFRPNTGTSDIIRFIVDINDDGQSDNVAPIIEGTPPDIASPNTFYSFTPVASDRNLFEPLTFSVQNLPPWASFDTDTGEIFGTPFDADFGEYSNIIITVEDDESPTPASASLGPFSITVTDPIGPNVISTVDDNGDGTSNVTLTCVDNGSGCSGLIYYTLDGSDPSSSGTRILYIGLITDVVDPMMLQFWTEDSEGNSSSIQSAQFVSLDTPTDGFIGNVTSISGTIYETFNSVTGVTIQVVGSDDTVLTESGGNQFLLPGFPPPIATTVDNALDTWEYSKTVPWTNDVMYTVTATATDSSGNTSSVISSFVFFNGTAAATDMLLSLTNNAILNNSEVDATLNLVNLSNAEADLTGTPVVLHVTDPDGILVDINLFTNISGSVVAQQLGNGDNGLVFNKPGVWTLQAEFDNTGTPNLQSALSDANTLLVGSSAGYAVIVEGKLPGVNDAAGLASHNKTANRVYQSFKDRGLVDDDIFYYNFATNQAGVDGVPSRAVVQGAIENLASEINNRPAPLYLVMVDHGGKASPAQGLATRFFLDDEIIEPTDLALWLSNLETNMDALDLTLKDNNPRVVIIGACYSGGFIDAVSATGRVVVTSATKDEQSFKGPVEDDNIRVGEYFLEELFIELGNGNNLRDAFRVATDKTETYTKESSGDTNNDISNVYIDTATQHPLLDDDGNGDGTNTLFENSLDGQLAKDIILGISPDSIANDAFNPAAIIRVSSTQYLADGDSDANLDLYANDIFQVNQAYVEIRDPAKTLALALDSTTDQQSSDYDRRAFIPPEAQGDAYTLTYDQFIAPGKYELYHYVNDRFTSELSPAVRSIIYKDSPANSDFPTTFNLQSPTNNATGLTIAGFNWEDSTDADGLTYTFMMADDLGFTTFTQANNDGTCSVVNTPYIEEELTSSSTYVDANARLCDFAGNDGYYWKAIAVDAFGRTTESTSVFFYETNDTNADIATIITTLRNATVQHQFLIASNVIGDQIINQFGEQASASVFYNGKNVIFTSNLGVIQTVTAQIPDFEDKPINIDPLQNKQTVELLFDMQPSATTNSDGDTLPDSSDNCPTVDNEAQTNTDEFFTDGDSLGDACDDDDDADGMTDLFEINNGLNPNDPSDATGNLDGDSFTNIEEFRNGTDPNMVDTVPTDTDNDGVLDGFDNCINTPNTDQLDNEPDGIGDLCDDDDDNDGMSDAFEELYGLDGFNAGDAGGDPDGDGISNLDEFTGGTNPTINNFDNTDTDTDLDTVFDTVDNCPNDANLDQADFDNDSVGDACDADDDNDGVLDGPDLFPFNANESGDADTDGLGDNADIDDDNDGMSDTFEQLYNLNPLSDTDANEDPDGDGSTNLEEFIAGTSPRVSNVVATTAPSNSGGGGGLIHPVMLLYLLGWVALSRRLQHTTRLLRRTSSQ